MSSEMPPPPPSLVGEGSSAAAAAPSPSPSPYVILCDAGSTGTRLYVYSLPPFGQHTSSNPADLPYDMHAVQIQEGPKIKPGLSAQTPETAPTYLLPAFEAALEMIPPEHHAGTPVYVYATAGMRLLDARLQEDIYDALAEGLRSHPDVVPFRVDRENLGTIDGTDEGYFAALAVNYLGGVIGSDLVTLPATPEQGSDGLPDRNDLDRDRRRLSWFGSKRGSAQGANNNHRTLLGALDLGGASAQIVFDSSTLSPSHRRRLQEAVEHQNHYQQQQYQQQLPVGMDNRNRPRALASAADPAPFEGGLRGASPEADGTISMGTGAGASASGRSISRNDFFSLSLLGYGGERMRDSIDAYLEELHQQRSGQRRRRLQAANLRPMRQRRAAMAQRLLKKNKNKDENNDGTQADPQADGGIDNPCYPPGYTVTLPSGHTHVGTGQGDVCMEHLDAVMERNAQGSCDPGQFCVDLLGPGIEPPVQETFFAFTLFSYPLNFARDVIQKIKDDNDGKLPKGKPYKDLHRIDKQLQEDNPDIKTLRDVTSAACSWDYPYLVEALPGEDRVAFRCMELGLATTLLAKFGFPEDGHNVHFTDEIGGASAEWTLGAYLHLLNHDGKNAAEAPDGGSWYIHPNNLVTSSRAALTSGMLYSDVAILIGAIVSLAFCARMVVKRSWINSVSYHAVPRMPVKAVGRMAPTRSISMPIR